MARTRAGQTRRMVLKDLPAVGMIERASFKDPCSPAELNELRLAHDSIVYTIAGVVVGYVIFHASRFSTSLVSIAVDPYYRRCGIGSALMSELDRCPKPWWGLVREENLTAHLFLRQEGWKCVKIVRTPYDSCDSDGYLFRG